MDHEVIRAIGILEQRGLLSGSQAALFGRVARREIVSVRLELRALLTAGVVMLTTGVGLLVRQNYQRIGPVAVAAAIFAAAGLCLAWVVRKSPTFSRDEVPSPNVAFDYVLLLGVVLFGSGLAWVESQFHTLGPSWRHHLLVVALVYFVAAFRYDSRAVLSLALTSFAAWRGVDARISLRTFFGNDEAAIRWNAIFCALLFLLAAWVCVRRRWKAHFEGVFSNLGLLLLLGALVSGVVPDAGSGWLLWEAALVAVGSLVVVLAWRLRRTLWFAQGIVAVYLGLLRLFLEAFHGAFGWLVVAASSLWLVTFLVRVHRKMREEG